MIDLIQAATLSENNEARTRAEQQLQQFRQEKTTEFFLQVSKIMTSEQVSPQLRQSAGILLSSSIITISNGGALWDRLQNGIKQSLKDSVLSVMIAKDRNVRRAAANVVAAICCIQIPRNEWPNIVPNLAGNLKNPSQTVREVSIITLGFICDGLKKRNHMISGDIQETILSAILLGVTDQNPENKMTSLKAFRDSLYSMNTILEKTEYRDYVVKCIVQQISNPFSCTMAIQVLIEFAKNFYQFLEGYINGLFTLLQPIMLNSTSKHQESCIMAMEFWQTVAGQYKSQEDEGSNVKKYIQGDLAINLCKILLQNLCVMNGQDEDEQNPVHESAGKALQTISECGAQPLVDTFINFTKNTITHTDWKFRQASTLAFGILLQGLPIDHANSMVTNSIVNLLALMSDKSQRVTYSVLQSMMLITEICGEAILRHQNFLDILKLIMSQLTKSENRTKQVCTILKNLCRACQVRGLQNFTGIANDIINTLISTCMNQNSSLQVLNDSMLVIMDLIAVSNSEVVCINQINFALENFAKLGQISMEKRRQMESGFLTIIQTCLIASIRKTNLDSTVLQKIYTLVTDYFSRVKDVTQDGMYVISALVSFMPNNQKVLESLWGYVQHALRNYQNGSLFRATLACITALLHKYSDQMANKLTFIDKFLTLMNDNSVDRTCKLQILTCLGDIVLICGRIVQPQIDKIMETILLFCEGAFHLTKVDFAFSQTIKECIIDTLFCIFHGLCEEGHQCRDLIKYFEPIFKFIQLSVNKTNRPTVDYIKKCMVLIADVRGFYPQAADPFTKLQYVFDSLEQLKKHNKNDRFTKDIAYVKSRF